MSKQTAVDWLVQNIVEDQTIKAKSMSEWIKIFEQSKAMEKEQIMNAVDIGFEEGSKFPEDIRLNNSEEYYNETYGGDK